MSSPRAFAVSLLLVCLVSTTALAAAPDVPIPTFNRDVMPIMEEHCQQCHRSGEIAPMPLTTYKEARPFAAAINEAVTLRKMPPWYADPHYGHFTNDISLSAHDIALLSAWAKNGAPEGDPKDLPPARQFTEGWNIRKPDMVLQMPAAFNVPARGAIDYQYVLIPGKFDKDVWVQMVEVRPDNRAVLHHVIAFVRPPNSKWLTGIKPGVPYVPTKEESDMSDAEFLVGYAPGMPPDAFPPGRAKLIRAGSDIIFQMHYTTNGHAGTDQTKIGIVFANAADVKQRVLTLAATNDKFEIPAGDSNYQAESEFEFGTDSRIVSLMPHMHLRGKDFEFKAIYPTGESQVLLRVPNYSFSWQLVYVPQGDIVVPKGTRIHCTAHYDNSANNPYNPDPSKRISWGDQSWDEMMIGFFDVAFDKNMAVKELFPPEKTEKAEAVAPKREGSR
jgi:hypothetical protein